MENINEANLYPRDAIEIVSDCYTDLSKYVIKTRAYPSVVDGMKAVYRRTIYASRIYKNKVKTVAIVGEAIKLHPHGDGNLSSAVNRMTCKYGEFPLYDGKGNFGGLGGSAAAPRYTETCLSDLGRLMCLDLVDYVEMIDGEAGSPEPKFLPSLLPYCLLAGSSGIPVGMPAPNIPPLNPMDLVNYYIDKLEGKPNPRIPLPDLGKVILDDSLENIQNVVRTGEGRLYFKGVITQEDYNVFSITQSTPRIAINDIPSKFQKYIDEDILEVMDESDKNGYRFVFTVADTKALDPKAFKKKLERIMACSKTYKFILEEDEKAVYCGIDYIFKKNIKYLRECTVRKYTDLSRKAYHKLEVYRAIRDFKNKGYVTKLNEMTEEEVISVVEELGYPREIGKALLDKPTRYLLKSRSEEIIELEEDLKLCEDYKENPDKYLLTKYYELRKMIEPMYNSRPHSIVKELIEDRQNYSIFLEGTTLKIKKSTEGVKWEDSIYIVTDLGEVTKKFISSRFETIIELNPEEFEGNIIKILPDSGKYIVLKTGKYLSVKLASSMKDKKRYLKLWDDFLVEDAITTNSENLQVIDESNNLEEVHLENWIKSRISYPSKCTKYDIRELVEVSDE